jgi:hypothetical protein
VLERQAWWCAAVARRFVRALSIRRRWLRSRPGPSSTSRSGRPGSTSWTTTYIEHRHLVYTESLSDEAGRVLTPVEAGMPDGHPIETQVIVELKTRAGVRGWS